jgi:hypothetical protein
VLNDEAERAKLGLAPLAANGKEAA